ncbi:MAG TPA: type II toxin-antitoxin system VapC family toxin [Pyrinomonadaceae bacterium]|jgi:PIN domain nuclease of toxin-antitoxin system
MRLLLDTHAFLWFLMGDPRLSASARALIQDVANERLLSVGSLWEMAIKTSLGKLALSAPFDVLIPQQLAINGVEPLGISVEHTAVVSTLPFHHRDPFDRLIIAQATVESIPIVSMDTAFDMYAVKRLW